MWIISLAKLPRGLSRILQLAQEVVQLLGSRLHDAGSGDLVRVVPITRRVRRDSEILGGFRDSLEVPYLLSAVIAKARSIDSHLRSHMLDGRP